MATKHFDIPDFHFFAEKNIFSGSKSRYFNFKIWYGEKFVIKVWHGETCFSATPESEIFASAEFDFTPESVLQMDLWLAKQYEEFCGIYSIVPE